nr:YgiT-type zinc finger protein [Anaerolineae bacterium]
MACRMGLLRPTAITYYHWTNRKPIILPNIRAWACDVCGDIIHESDAIERLELLLKHTPPTRSFPSNYPLASSETEDSQPPIRGRLRSV